MMKERIPLPALEHFPPIPRDGLITVAEAHSEIHTLPSTPDNPSTGIGHCPTVGLYLATDGHELKSRLPYKIPSIKLMNGRTSLLVERQQGVPKALWDAWWEDGIQGIDRYLRIVDASHDLGNTTKALVKLAGSMTTLWIRLFELPFKIVTSIYPHLGWGTEAINEEFSHVRRWKESWVRAIAWHPTWPQLALALDDDSVRCTIVGRDIFPMLRCQEQRNVSCVAWRPITRSEIAVGCEDCIVLWLLTSSGSMKPGKDRTKIITVDGHGPVNSVDFSSDGSYLLSSSAKDSSVYIWDAFSWHKAPLMRLSGAGIPLATWAPTRCRILAASPSRAFWVWDSVRVWNSKRWDTPKTRIEAACWNPDGTIVLFASEGFIYGLFFNLSAVDKFVAQQSSVVKPIYNIEECHVLDCDENLAFKVGGKVREMDWDSTGHRLAVMFDESDMIALFRVLPSSRSELITPLGFLRGHPGESPLAIAFQKDFTEGALLTIAWSSGRIQHFPMVFALPTVKKNILHEDHYRTQQVVHSQPSHFEAAGFVSPRLSVTRVESSTAGAVPAHSSSGAFLPQDEHTSPTRLYSL